MDEQPKVAEAFVCLDVRFNRLAAGKGFLIFDEKMRDAFESVAKASVYFAARGGELQQNPDGPHFLRKMPNLT